MHSVRACTSYLHNFIQGKKQLSSISTSHPTCYPSSCMPPQSQHSPPCTSATGEMHGPKQVKKLGQTCQHTPANNFFQKTFHKQ